MEYGDNRLVSYVRKERDGKEEVVSTCAEFSTGFTSKGHLVLERLETNLGRPLSLE